MEKIRVFIAIELDETIQEAIRPIQEYLQKTGADVKWVKPHHIHLTLKFLGEAPIHQIEPITQILQIAAQSLNPFSIALAHVGAFPNIDHPRVIWLGINQGKDHAKAIAEILEEKLEKIGFAKEKRDFDPHITIGRVRSGLNRFALFKALQTELLSSPLIQEATHIVLFKSTLTPQGPIYEALKKVYFAKS